MQRLSILVLAFFTTTTAAFGTVIVSHVGANDPTTEGWTLKDESGGQHIYGPVYNDLGHTDAWRLDSATNHASGDLEYEWWLSEAEVNDALSQGWSLTGSIRLVEASSERNSLTFRFSTGTLIYQIFLIGDVGSDPTIKLGDGRTVTLNGGGGAYHTYCISDDNADGVADLFIDGSLVFSNYTPSPTTLYNKRIIEFGDIQDGNAENAHALFSMVQFEILPEPSTALLLAAGSVMFRRWRRRPT